MWSIRHGIVRRIISRGRKEIIEKRIVPAKGTGSKTRRLVESVRARMGKNEAQATDDNMVRSASRQ